MTADARRAETPVKAALTDVVVAVQPPLWAELLSQALAREAGVRIRGCAANEDEVKALVSDGEPAVVVLDYEALGPNAEGMIARVRRGAPRARVLVLARRAGTDSVVSVLRAGAAGLVSKAAPLATLRDAIRATAAGQVWASRETTAQVIDQLVATGRDHPNGDPCLTRREWEVLEVIARGHSNRVAARRLGISEKTVKTHLNSIFAKTGLRGRFAVALWAQGQVQPKT